MKVLGHSFARTAHLFACSGLLASFAPSAVLTRLLARSLRSLPGSWDSEWLAILSVFFSIFDHSGVPTSLSNDHKSIKEIFISSLAQPPSFLADSLSIRWRKVRWDTKWPQILPVVGKWGAVPLDSEGEGGGSSNPFYQLHLNQPCEDIPPPPLPLTGREGFRLPFLHRSFHRSPIIFGLFDIQPSVNDNMKGWGVPNIGWTIKKM